MSTTDVHPGGPNGTWPVNEAATQRYAEVRERQLVLPYLGPDPQPSLAIGRVLVAALLVAATVRLALAASFAQLAVIDGHVRTKVRVVGYQVVRSQTLPHSDAPAIATLNHRLHSLASPAMVTLLIAVMFIPAWSQRRRPSAVLAASGETHVEVPAGLILPGKANILWGVTLLGAVVSGVMGMVNSSTPLSDLQFHRQLQALSALLWAAFLVLQIARVVGSERIHRRRMALSGPARAGLVTVEPVAPIVHIPDVSREGGEGAAWVFKTAGGVMLGTIATGVAIGCWITIFQGGADLGVYVWGLGATAIDALLVRAMVRRRRNRRAALAVEF